MADFFRNAVGSEQKKSPKATKGSSSKGSKVTKGSRSLANRSSKTLRKDQDRSGPISVESSSVSTSKHARVERNDNNDGETSPETQPVPPPSLIRGNIDEPTDHQANHGGEPMSNQADGDPSNNFAAITTSINPHEAKEDRPGVREPMYVLPFILDTAMV